MFTAAQYRSLLVIYLLILAGLGWLGSRLYDIQVARHKELGTKARQLTTVKRWQPAWRGEIQDRNGQILAISAPTKAVYLNAAVCSNHIDQVARACGPWLGNPPTETARRLRAALRGEAGSTKALSLKRDVSLVEWEAWRAAWDRETFGYPAPRLGRSESRTIEKLRQRALFARDTQDRLYPYDSSLAQTLGFVSLHTNRVGLKGAYGIERSLDAVLSGQNGFLQSRQDSAGNEMPRLREQFRPPAHGCNVVLTIDMRLQQSVEEILTTALATSQARSASAIVLDARTFEILALAGQPGFDPNAPADAPNSNWRIPAIHDRVEPGSTFKLVTLAAALDQGLVNLDTVIDCHHGHYVVNRVAVRDHGRHGLLPLRQCFAKSSNIAFAQLGLQLGPQRFYHYMTNFGFGRPTGVSLSDEVAGYIEPPANWSTMALTRASFGQGISVSQLQMTVAMGAIANEGRLMKPWLVSRIESPKGQALRQFGPQSVRAVVYPKTAARVKEALKAVVSRDGTAGLAAMEEHTVAAKTGTAQKANAQGYRKGAYYSSVVGFFPADAPRVVISVALDEPKNGYYAGEVAAPVFRAVAEQMAAVLQIPPDKGSKLTKRKADPPLAASILPSLAAQPPR